MNILVFDTYKEMSEAAAADIAARLARVSEPVFCPASGDSPIGIYHSMIERHNRKELDLSHWQFVGLDEWLGLDKFDQGSCRFMLDRDLLSPLQVEESRICFFNGKAEHPEQECGRIDAFIREKNGIDLALLGLGMNGHIGMNEPGTSVLSETHVATLDPITQQVGQKYFTTPHHLTKGMTLGIATLLRARQLVLVVNGPGKAGILQRVMEGEISSDAPASLLRNHPDFTLYADADAASLLRR